MFQLMMVFQNLLEVAQDSGVAQGWKVVKRRRFSSGVGLYSAYIRLNRRLRGFDCGVQFELKKLHNKKNPAELQIITTPRSNLNISSASTFDPPTAEVCQKLRLVI